jgi:hypothetical protein
MHPANTIPKRPAIFWMAFLPLLFSGIAFGQAARLAPAALDVSELHGGIELSPRVVRAIAVQIPADGNIKVLFSYSLPLTAPSYVRDGKLTPEYIKDAAQTVQKAFLQLQLQYKVPEYQIYILGLSDFTAPNTSELGAEIRENTGRNTAFINAEAETELSIAGTIPRRYREGAKTFDNRGGSLLLDIGSAAIRGGYQQIKLDPQGAPEFEFVTWNIPRGLTAFSGEVGRDAGETADLSAYAKRAQALGATSIRSLLSAETSRKPPLLGRRKIYLTGGIVWVMMTLLHPEDQSNYSTVTMEDIDQFHTRALIDPESLLNPDLSKIRDEAYRGEMRRARDTIKQTYPPKLMLAGAEMLKAIGAEMQFENRTVIYPRYAWLARILSYVRLKPE